MNALWILLIVLASIFGYFTVGCVTAGVAAAMSGLDRSRGPHSSDLPAEGAVAVAVLWPLFFVVIGFYCVGKGFYYLGKVLFWLPVKGGNKLTVAVMHKLNPQIERLG